MFDTFEFLSFDIVSDFGFRASNFSSTYFGRAIYLWSCPKYYVFYV